MANCLAVWLLFVCCSFFFSVCIFLFTFFLQPPIRAMLKHDSNTFSSTQLISSRPEEKWLRISFFATQPDPIYFYILYNTVISVWAEYSSSSVTLTWNTSSCMGLELLHVNGNSFYQICALF